jgi:hypothetical protein
VKLVYVVWADGRKATITLRCVSIIACFGGTSQKAGVPSRSNVSIAEQNIPVPLEDVC